MSIITRIFTKHKHEQLPVAYGRLIPPHTFYKINGKMALSGGMYKTVVRCPFCYKEHAHGGCKDLRKLVPTRQAHCGGGRYELKIEGGPR